MEAPACVCVCVCMCVCVRVCVVRVHVSAGCDTCLTNYNLPVYMDCYTCIWRGLQYID